MNTPSIAVTLDSKVIERKTLNKDIISIGREFDNDIIINNLGVSRYHALLYNKNGRMLIKDLGSANGTYLNGTKVVESDLYLNDLILIGKHVLKIYIDDEIDTLHDVAYHSEGKTMMVDTKTYDKYLNNLKVDQGKCTAITIVFAGKKYALNEDMFLIGKDKVADLKISGLFIKPFHAKIINQNDGNYKLVSENSFFRPTKINGVKVNQKILTNGDIIKIGSHHMLVSF